MAYYAAPLRIVLTDKEVRILSELRVAQSVPYRTCDQANMLLLNAQGWKIPAIAQILGCHEHIVRPTLRQWESDGLGGLLWEALCISCYLRISARFGMMRIRSLAQPGLVPSIPSFVAFFYRLILVPFHLDRLPQGFRRNNLF
jgi:hypothetical protein